MWEGKGVPSRDCKVCTIMRGWSPDFLESLPVRKFLTMMLCWVSLSKCDSCSELWLSFLFNKTFSSSEQLLAKMDTAWGRSYQFSISILWTKTCEPRAAPNSGKQFAILRMSTGSLHRGVQYKFNISTKIITVTFNHDGGPPATEGSEGGESNGHLRLVVRVEESTRVLSARSL